MNNLKGASYSTRKKMEERGKNISLIGQIAELLVMNRRMSNDELASRLGISEQKVSYIRKDLLQKSDLERAEYVLSHKDDTKPVIIPEFKPTVGEIVVSKEGKTYRDVSEFYGVVEYGGRCYQNTKFTIPKGDYNARKAGN